MHFFLQFIFYLLIFQSIECINGSSCTETLFHVLHEDKKHYTIEPTTQL